MPIGSIINLKTLKIKMYSSQKKITNLEIFIFVISILIPLSVIFSRFLLNAIVIGFFLFLIFRSFKNKNWKFLYTEITPYLFAFLFYLFFASIIIHELDTRSFLKLTWLFLIVFFLLGLASYVFVLKKNLIKILVLFFFFLTAFVILDSIYQFFNPEFKDIFGYKSNTIREYSLLGRKFLLPIRLTGPMGDEQVVGFYLSTFGFLSIFFFKYLFKLSNKIYYLFIFINFSIIILSGERSSVLIFMITFFTQELLSKAPLKNKLSNILILFLILMTAFYANPTTRERANDLNIWLLKPNNHNNFYENFLRTPWGGHYQISIELIKTNPYFGVGLRNFSKSCVEYEKNDSKLNLLRSMRVEYKIMQTDSSIAKEIIDAMKNKIITIENEIFYNGKDSKCSTHPHNYIVELLVETGLIGFLFFFSLLFKIYYIFFKKFKQNNFAIICISLLTGFMFPFKPSGAIFSSWFGFIFWLQISFFLMAINTKINKKIN
jgi:O-antigen ligase